MADALQPAGFVCRKEITGDVCRKRRCLSRSLITGLDIQTTYLPLNTGLLRNFSIFYNLSVRVGGATAKPALNR